MANNLALTSPAFDTTGQKFGTAALSGGYGIAPLGLINGSPTTWECQFRRSAAPSSLEVIMGQSGLGFFAMTTTGQIQFEVGASGNQVDYTSSTAAADGAWHHAAISISSNGFMVFLDGAVVGSSSSSVQGAITSPSGTGTNGTGYLGVGNHGGLTNYQFGGEVDEAAVWTNARYTGAFTPPTAAYTGTESSLLALWHLDSNGNDSTGTASASPAVVVSPTNSALLYSAYNWSGGKTINPGAYLRFAFTGNALSFSFDLSAQSSPLPEIWVSVDGQPAQQFTLATTITASMPSTTSAWPEHTAQLIVKSTSEFVNRWSPQAAAVVLTGIGLSSGSTVVAVSGLARSVVCFGDSITEGYHTVANLGSGQTDTDGSDAVLGWAYMLGRHLGAEVSVVGFGGTGLLNNGQGGVPPVGQSYSQIWSGVARSFSPTPSLVVINEGENDKTADTTTFQTAFQTFLGALLASIPSCPVAVLRPFSGAQATAIQGAIQAVGNARLHYIDTTGLFDTSLSVDGQHPLGVANLKTIGPGVAALISPLLSGVPNRWSHS